MADLVAHIGQTQHWVAEIIEQRITNPAQLPSEMAVAPTDADQWQTWLSESAERIVSACSDDALDAPVFNASGDERSGTRFWLTSMLNEAVLHGFDATNTANQPDTIEPHIAAALISNHLTMLTSPTWAMQRPESANAIRGTGQTLQWQATDASDAWFIERQPDNVTWQPTSRPADVTVTGPTRSLLLLMTRRHPLTTDDNSGVTITGDNDLVQHWLDNTAHVSGCPIRPNRPVPRERRMPPSPWRVERRGSPHQYALGGWPRRNGKLIR